MQVIEESSVNFFECVKKTAQEIVIGTIVSVSDEDIFVDFNENPLEVPLKVLCTVPIDKKSVGRKAALLFINSNLLTPVLIGLIRQTSAGTASEFTPSTSKEPHRELSFTSLERITLECGQSSLTMSNDGKIILKGKTISSYAEGVNRVRGAIVEVN